MTHKATFALCVRVHAVIVMANGSQSEVVVRNCARHELDHWMCAGTILRMHSENRDG